MPQEGRPKAVDDPSLAHTTRDPDVASQRHMIWSLLVNATVEIRKDSCLVRTGRVDTVMPDDSIIWLAADENGPRQLFPAAEGFEVWVEPRELDGKYSFRMTASLLREGIPGVTRGETQ
ncbi:hypothetical protein StoSoilA2_20740 [Arthrobacter sp. StoSoilA2]|nr:hypothetical protein StoSoilA2_20740 [Arthrobacter sp. StoSoilA2]